MNFLRSVSRSVAVRVAVIVVLALGAWVKSVWSEPFVPQLPAIEGLPDAPPSAALLPSAYPFPSPEKP